MEKIILALKKIGNATIGIMALTPIIGHILLNVACVLDWNKDANSKFMQFLVKRIPL